MALHQGKVGIINLCTQLQAIDGKPSNPKASATIDVRRKLAAPSVITDRFCGLLHTLCRLQQVFPTCSLEGESTQAFLHPPGVGHFG